MAGQQYAAAWNQPMSSRPLPGIRSSMRPWSWIASGIHHPSSMQWKPHLGPHAAGRRRLRRWISSDTLCDREPSIPAKRFAAYRIADRRRSRLGNQDTFDSIRSLISEHSIQLHTLLQTSLASEHRGGLLGLAPQSSEYRTYAPDGQGGYQHQLASQIDVSTPSEMPRKITLIWQCHCMGLHGISCSCGAMPIPNPAVSNDFPSLRLSLRRSAIASINRSKSICGRVTSKPRSYCMTTLYRAERSPSLSACSAMEMLGTLTSSSSIPNLRKPYTDRVPVAIAAGYGYDYLAVDPDGDTLRYDSSLPRQPVQNRRCHAALMWSPDSSGSHDFHLIATDPWGGRDDQVWTAASNTPTLTNRPRYYKPLDDRSHPAMRRLQLLLQATDPENDPNLSIDPQRKTVMPRLVLTSMQTTGLLEWTPLQRDVGVHEIAMRVIDGHGGSSTQTLTLHVSDAELPINRARSL